MSASTSSKSNPPRPRKRVDVDLATSTAGLKRARDGSAFTRCDSCKKDIHVALADMHDCNLEAKTRANLALPTETKSPAPKKPAETKSSKRKSPEVQKKPKKLKRTKDPNQPKKPPTAFFVFMEEFRKTYKEANPDSKGIAMVAKEGGEKWKSLKEEEKEPYTKKAAELKEEYLKAYSKYQEDLKKDNGDDEADAAEVDKVDEDAGTGSDNNDE